MIELSCSLDELQNSTEIVAQIEEFCQECEISSWIIIREKPETPYLITGYFFSEREALDSWESIRVQFPILPQIPHLSSIEDKDWKNAYKQYIKPWSFENLHWIPLWEKSNVSVGPKDIAIYLDAGMAFGTGAHETTRLCAQRLVEYRNSHINFHQASVIDAGCGSGILSISAKRMGFGDIQAFDIDPLAIEVSIENAQSNQCNEGMNFSISDLEKGLVNRTADIVIANIQADILTKGAYFLVQAVNPSGCLILSGILDKEWEIIKKEFTQVFESRKMKITCSSNKMGEWRDLFFVRQ